MITTAKNKRGYITSSLIFICNIVLLFMIAFFSMTSEIRSQWFIMVGLIVSLLVVLYQLYLVVRQRVYTRLSFLHSAILSTFIVTLLCCWLIPTQFSDTYSNLQEDAKSRANILFHLYLIEIIPISVLFISILFNKSQRIQYWLHPFSEIIDGFQKSNGTIQMTSIKSAAMSSGSSLKQVVVDPGTGGIEENVVGVESVDQGQSSKSTSPKPSKVLKTWPKADPFPVKALYSFKTDSPSELPFKKGDTITVLDCRGRWWQAQIEDRIGFIPSNYITVLKKAKVRSSFVAVESDEVSVLQGQEIEVMEKYDLKCLVRTVDDKIGAVPTDKLEFVEE